MRDEAELTAYAAGRWATAVRTLVLLGAPPAAADRLAADAVARLLEMPEDEWRDADVVFFAEVLDAWERDRAPWWTRPSDDDRTTDSGLAEIEPALDALDEPTRAHLVLVGVARLTRDQADDVVGVAVAETAIAPESLAMVADGVVVGAAPLAAVRATTRSRSRRRRGVVALAVVAGLAAAAALTPAVIAALDRPAVVSSTSDEAGAEPRVEEEAVGQRGLEPVAWYSGGRLHEGERTTRVPGVVALARLSSAVVATLADGRLVQVRAGATFDIGTGTPGVAVATDPEEGLAAWVDPRGPALVVRDQRLGAAVVQLPVTARTQVVEVADGKVLLSGPDRIVDLDTGTPRARPAPGGHALDPELSPDGRYLLTGSTKLGSGVVERGTGLPLDLRVRGQDLVVDAAFGASDSVTFVLARANGAPYPSDWRADDDYHPGFDLVTCRLSTQGCRIELSLFDIEDPPLLAQ